MRCCENADAVGELVISQDDKPHTHRTQREITRDLGISIPFQ